MRTSINLCALGVTLLSLAACSGEKPAATPFKPVVDTRTLMAAVVDPAADHIWGAVGMDITATGRQEIKPQTDADWLAVRNSAVTLAEAGNLLMMSPRAVDNNEWIRLCQALTETASNAIQVADAKNADQLFDAGGEIYAVCTNCHSKYDPQITGGLLKK